METKEAIFGGGCFWGVEYYMKRLAGVISVESGYCGGHVENPTYQQVKTGSTGHAEVVRVVYDPSITNYETLLRFFMEIHDPTTENRQGVDIGSQYRSEIFYSDESEREIAEKVVKILYNKGLDVVSYITPIAPFYKAEDYHQNYYDNIGRTPSCHFYTKRF